MLFVLSAIAEFASPRWCNIIFFPVWALLAAILLVTITCVYRLTLHPLARVPGPWLAALSNIWQAWHVREGRMLTLAQDLHRRYGPAVRVGPNEVWFDSPEAHRAIYGLGSGFKKSDFYLATLLQSPEVSWNLELTHPDSLDLLSERDVTRYRQQRRTIRPRYTLASLKKHEPALDAAIDRILDALAKLDAETVDLKEWMHAAVVECLGAVVLGGWSSGYLQARSDGGSSSHAHMAWRRKSVVGLFPLATVLGMLSKTFDRLFSVAWGVAHRPPRGFKPFFPAVQRKMMRRISSAITRRAPPKACPDDLLDELIRLHMDKPDEFPETYLRRMAMTNFGAGHETMTSAMMSVLAMLGTHPHAQQQAYQEIQAAAVPRGERLTHDHVLRMPYTLACIKEAQRLYPVIGMSLARTVPATISLRLHGHALPAGTTVGCVPAALHRNRAVFGPDAASFRPGRWLDAAPDAVRIMERVNLTYGGGMRTCPGRHLAELVMRKLVVKLLAEFEVVAKMPPEEACRYYFLAFLTGATARFVRRSGRV